MLVHSWANIGCRVHSTTHSVQVRRVRSVAPWGFVRVRPGGRRIHSGSFDSFLRAKWVVWLISARSGDRCVHSGAPLLSSGSFGFVGFIRSRPGGRRAHSVSLGSFKRALGVVRYIRVHSGSFERVVGVVGFIRVRWVHSGAPLGSSGLFELIGHIGVCPDGRRVNLGAPWGSLG